jgi:hypothetical protein
MASASKKKKGGAKPAKKAAAPKKPAAKTPARPAAAKPAGKKTPPPSPHKPVAAPPAKIAPGAASKTIPLPGKTGAAAAGKPMPSKPGAPVPGKPGVAGLPTDGGRPGIRPGGPRPVAKKGGRKSPLSQRRGPNGEPFVPGDLLLPTGPQGPDEIQYLLRGSVAAEHAAGSAGVSEIILKKGAEAEADRGELTRYAEGMAERFEKGSIEPLLPSRPPARRNFAGVVERAKHRRREIGAFLRGLDLGRTETSHMDSHGEASLQSLMEWAARLENLAEADEPERADFAQLHRGLDQLENKTEELIVDVELTLRRLRDRLRTAN